MSTDCFEIKNSSICKNFNNHFLDPKSLPTANVTSTTLFDNDIVFQSSDSSLNFINRVLLSAALCSFNVFKSDSCQQNLRLPQLCSDTCNIFLKNLNETLLSTDCENVNTVNRNFAFNAIKVACDGANSNSNCVVAANDDDKNNCGFINVELSTSFCTKNNDNCCLLKSNDTNTSTSTSVKKTPIVLTPGIGIQSEGQNLTKIYVIFGIIGFLLLLVLFIFLFCFFKSRKYKLKNTNNIFSNKDSKRNRNSYFKGPVNLKSENLIEKKQQNPNISNRSRDIGVNENTSLNRITESEIPSTVYNADYILNEYIDHNHGNQFLIAIHDFIPRSADEVELSKGDKILVIERYDDDFGLVENTTTNLRGVCPLTFLTEENYV
ncbi:hypothetical protein HDU92_003488 [Lobulomyces angularis]|nr:hypothetical protein HDU92_003488 [Lobulomyces angularis]